MGNWKSRSDAKFFFLCCPEVSTRRNDRRNLGQRCAPDFLRGAAVSQTSRSGSPEGSGLEFQNPLRFQFAAAGRGRHSRAPGKGVGERAALQTLREIPGTPGQRGSVWSAVASAPPSGAGGTKGAGRANHATPDRGAGPFLVRRLCSRTVQAGLKPMGMRR